MTAAPDKRIENTADQRKAARPDASVWVEASAGTGKTKVLTDRILSLLLAGTRPDRLLALTFTKAAAGEMANRVARRLGDWATMPADDLAWDIENITGRAAAEDELRRARRLFAQVLDVPGGMRVQTIHAFCESLLKRFPLEAGVIPHFTVLDERDAAALLDDCRNLVLRGAEGDTTGTLSEAVATVSTHVNEESFTGVLGAIIGERARIANLKRAHGGISGIIGAVRDALGLEDDDTAATVIAAACTEGEFDETGLRATAEALLLGTGKTDPEKAAPVIHWLDSPEERAASFDDYASIFLTAKGELRSEKTICTKSVENIYPNAKAVMLAEGERLLEVADRIRAVTTAEATAALLTLGDAVLAAYAQGKIERAALDYDDLILGTRSLLAEENRAAWVLYKLDGGIAHVLVDEAQDTNPEQWDVIRALTSEFFAGKGAREDTRTMFAVGDPKQSIYSFQRADPEAFLKERDAYENDVLQAKLAFDEVGLAKSFRTTRAVLTVVDKLFNEAPASDGVFLEGKTLRHDVHREGLAGRVEVWPAAVFEAGEETGPWAVPIHPVRQDSPRKRVAIRIAQTIRGWLDTGEMLESEGRPMKAGDILVLVPRRSAFVDELVRELKDLKVPVAGADRMVLTEQLPVMDLIALGRFLLLPEDDLTFAALLKSPLCGLDDEHLMALAIDRKGTLWEAFRDTAPGDPELAPVFDRLAALRAATDFRRPYDLYARVLSSPAHAGRQRLLARLGPDAEDPIEEFLSLALKYEQNNVPSLEGFLHWVEAGEAEIKRDLEQSGRDQVRIMTVHGAKGLEAPVVFLPDTFQKPNRGHTRAKLLWPGHASLMLWPPRTDDEDPVARAARDEDKTRQRHEHMRLLYVAMTRAAERLYVTGFLTQKEKLDDGDWLKPERLEDTWYGMIADAMTEENAHEFDTAGERWAGPWGTAGRRHEVAQEPDALPKRDETDRPPRAPEPLPEWAHAMPKPEEDPPRPLTPSKPRLAGPPVRSPLIQPGETAAPGGEADPFRRGNLIHRLLELLPGIPHDTREAAGAQYLARAASDVAEAARAQYLAETLAVLDAPDFAAAFAPGSRAEVPLTGVIASRVITGQIDRLAVENGRVLVIDYKTNRPPPERAEDVSPAYLAQMAAYRALLLGIYPGHKITCALLWTDAPRLMPLADELLERHAP